MKITLDIVNNLKKSVDLKSIVLDCKESLEQTNCDIESAKKWLLKSGETRNKYN
jgi:translation elongation factor EF-Ts